MMARSHYFFLSNIISLINFTASPGTFDLLGLLFFFFIYLKYFFFSGAVVYLTWLRFKSGECLFVSWRFTDKDL